MAKNLVTLIRGGRPLTYYMQADLQQKLFRFIPAFSNRDEPRFTIQAREEGWEVDGTNDPGLKESGQMEVIRFMSSGLGRTRR